MAGSMTTGSRRDRAGTECSKLETQPLYREDGGGKGRREREKQEMT